ncbi:hypothetical protein D3C71_1386730 [compost metagenome]
MVIGRAIPQGWRGTQHNVRAICGSYSGDGQIDFAAFQHVDHERAGFHPDINRQFWVHRRDAVKQERQDGIGGIVGSANSQNTLYIVVHQRSTGFVIEAQDFPGVAEKLNTVFGQ